ncbi:MAG: type IX secretion system protein PorQ [Chitinophagaceae bacterium]|nr:type IX secretion system protein PorQ [Chitinophagaceae bacterium]
MRKRISFLLLGAALLPGGKVSSQVLGGNSVFNFVRVPNTPQLTALGGVNLTQPSDDVGLAFNNPALLRPSMHSQVNAVFNNYYAGIRAMHLSTAIHHRSLNTTFSWGISYFDYGAVSRTDASGNVLGKFKPADWVMAVGASRQYLEKWQYGASLKFIYSMYGEYRASGLATDVGVVYKDTAKRLTASVVVKNLGVQLKKYQGAGEEQLPFDLQAGISWRLNKAPFGFSLTAHRLHQFDILYNDTVFNNSNGFSNSSGKRFTFDKLISHFVAGVTIYLGDRVELQAGYNFLKRRELSAGSLSNGLTGFSAGAGVHLGKIQVRYARAYYQGGTAWDHFGLTLHLNQLSRGILKR